jgi:hypothetical protein
MVFAMKKMKLQNQIVLVNASILIGLVFEYFRSTPLFIVVGVGIFLFLLVNVIFWVRFRRAKSVQ